WTVLREGAAGRWSSLPAPAAARGETAGTSPPRDLALPGGRAVRPRGRRRCNGAGSRHEALSPPQRPPAPHPLAHRRGLPRRPPAPPSLLVPSPPEGPPPRSHPPLHPPRRRKGARTGPHRQPADSGQGLKARPSVAAESNSNSNSKDRVRVRVRFRND